MNSILDTAKFEVTRRIRRDLREDGEISAESVEHHLTLVSQVFGVKESQLRGVAAAAIELSIV